MDAREPSFRSPVVGPRKPRLLQVLGPGLISGAANDDPTAIATYSQAGARFGFAFCWLMPLVYPVMAVVQQVSARIGRTTGHGLAGNIRRCYPGPLLQVSVALLLVANVFAISADLGAMADVLRLLIGGPHLLYVLLFGGLCVLLQVYMQYTRYVAVLKWTTLSLFAYFGAVLMVDVPWSEIWAAIARPPVVFDRDHLSMAVAIFGVALSPYIYFWQSSQEAEDQRVKPRREPLVEAPEQAPEAIERIRLDTYVGMALANLVGLAIIITTAATLHVNGAREIVTSAQAAEALRPLAGPFAFAVFALGIIGTGLLAVPVLAGSAAYAIGEARKWPVGLARRPLQAKAFYATLAVAILGGVAINFFALDPMTALYWSAIVNGVVAVPMLSMMMLVASHAGVMGGFTIGRGLAIFGWITTIVMASSVIGMAVAALL